MPVTSAKGRFHPRDRRRREAERSEQDPTAPRLVVGMQPVRECVRVWKAALEALVLAESDSPKLAALERFALAQGVKAVSRRSRAELDRLARGAQHQGALAFAPPLALTPWDDVLTRPNLLAVALDRLQDPQNFGAVVRSAVATGGAAIMWGENASAPLTPATFRASAGAIEHATLCRVPSLPDALTRARGAGVQVIGLAAQGDALLSDVDLRPPTVLVLGGEGAGLQPQVRRSCDRLAAVVRPTLLDSLNASVAIAIALYEAVKQRESFDGYDAKSQVTSEPAANH